MSLRLSCGYCGGGYCRSANPWSPSLSYGQLSWSTPNRNCGPLPPCRPWLGQRYYCTSLHIHYGSRHWNGPGSFTGARLCCHCGRAKSQRRCGLCSGNCWKRKVRTSAGVSSQCGQRSCGLTGRRNRTSIKKRGRSSQNQPYVGCNSVHGGSMTRSYSSWKNGRTGSASRRSIGGPGRGSC